MAILLPIKSNCVQSIETKIKKENYFSLYFRNVFPYVSYKRVQQKINGINCLAQGPLATWVYFQSACERGNSIVNAVRL